MKLARTDSDQLIDQILATMPASRYCLSALFRIARIELTTDVQTACVQGRAHPLLKINPEFVERHASTPEKLVMLVLHELHHIILGHLRRQWLPGRRARLLDNLVFDAVINSMLCHMMPHREYTSLLTDFYREDRFPECFLRPTPHWDPIHGAPASPAALQTPEHEHLADLHTALYTPMGVTYTDLRMALKDSLPPEMHVKVILMGNHHDGDDEDEFDLPPGQPHAIRECLDRIIADIPAERLGPGNGDGNGDPHRRQVRVVPGGNRIRLSRLLRRIGGDDAGSSGLARRKTPQDVVTPVPRFDRRTAALVAMGMPVLLHRGELEADGRRRTGDRVHIYVDVSGSMRERIGRLYGTLNLCRSQVHPVIHQFSTEVRDTSMADLRRGRLETTGGTDIACVADHMRRSGIRRVVLLTDGHVGTPTDRDRELLASACVGVALTGADRTREDLEGLVDHWAEFDDR